MEGSVCMTFEQFAEILFPHIDKTPEDYEKIYPERNLKEGAKVTRIAPSPTGFMHLGNLFGAITDERLAHQSEGVFILRIEDTDKKREVEGGVETIIRVFRQFGLNFDEGVTENGEDGNYGPYRQSKRAEIYQTFAKELVKRGLAYPCFCTEEELAEMRALQEKNKENFGYYGKYAKHRDMPFEEASELVKQGMPYVLRFKSPGNPEKKAYHEDLIKGKMEFPENDQDIVILKSDGIPTYHFAHVVDDHLMRTNIVVRGEEWLATLPVHLQLFDILGFKRPKYAHTAQLMKMDGESKRKLSKRKDPELALDFYREEGYPSECVIEYLITLLNSNFEDWRIANPNEDIKKFPFSAKKMSVSGSLFDMDKFNDVSKNVIARMTAEEVTELIIAWAKEFDAELYNLLNKDKEYALKIFAIGRGGKKPRKDFAKFSEVKAYINFFYDEIFDNKYEFPENMNNDLLKEVLIKYLDEYKDQPDMNSWFEHLCKIGESIGFAPSTKAYKENPESFKGSPGDVSQIIRGAVTGRLNSPDLYSVMDIMGEDKVKERLRKVIDSL